MTIPLGFDAAIYYMYHASATGYLAALADGGATPDGTYSIDANPAATGTPILADFTELDIVTDVTLNMSKSEADITNRSTSGFRAMRGTLKEGELTFDIMWDTGDAKFQDLFSSYYDNNPILFAILDGTWASGAQGLYSGFDVISFEKSEALEDAQRVSVTSKVTLVSPVVPRWVDVVDTA